MKSSPALIELLKEFESVRLDAYKCPAGVWTIGIGHTSAAGPPTVRQGQKIGLSEAEYILQRDLLKYEAGVERLVKVDLLQNQFDALVSFAYNCGIGALEKSTLLKRVNAKQFDKVPAEFMKWTKGGGKELPGLVRRRRAEAAMWRGVDEKTAPNHDESRAPPDAPVPSKPITKSKEGNAAILAGGASAVAAAQEVIPVVQQANDALSGVSEAFGKPAVLVLLLVVIAAAAIWYWRKQRLDEEGA
jgi:lysozyme